MHRAVQRRAVRERDQAGKLSQAVRSVYTDHMTHDALSTFNTMTHTRTHARMHAHTRARTHARTHTHVHARTLKQSKSKSHHQLCNSWLEWIRRDVSLVVTSKYDHASVSQWDCDKDSSRKCLLLQSHFEYINNYAVLQIISNCEKLPVQHRLQLMWIHALGAHYNMVCTVGTGRNPFFMHILGKPMKLAHSYRIRNVCYVKLPEL